MPEFTVDWLSHKLKYWKSCVVPALAGLKEIHALEIGSFEGRSALWICENLIGHRDGYLVCVDSWSLKNPDHTGLDTVEERFVSNLAPFIESGQLRKMKMKATEFFFEHAASLPLFDFIYVDGGHSTWDCLTDAVMSFHRLKVGGLLLFDDYDWHSKLRDGFTSRPKGAIDSFVACFEGKVELVVASRNLLLVRKVAN